MRLATLALLPPLLALFGRPVLAQDVTPGLSDDADVAAAEAHLDAIVAALPVPQRERLRGVYVAVETSPTDVVAMPACDDDGDYVLVFSRAFFDLLGQVAYADASDRLRGTHAVRDYGPLLARSQYLGMRPLPAPVARLAAEPPPEHAARWLASAFEDDALAWLVADELAHAVAGEVVCPSPTETHEAGDDVWTPLEEGRALALAPSRMFDLDGADAWATRETLRRGASEVPSETVLRVLATLEAARPRGQASTYLTLHPHSDGRVAVIEEAARAWHAAREGRSESAAAATPMR